MLAFMVLWYSRSDDNSYSHTRPPQLSESMIPIKREATMFNEVFNCELFVPGHMHMYIHMFILYLNLH